MTLTPEYRIAIIGPHNVISGFRALGVELFSANTAPEVIEQLKEIYAVTVDDSKPIVYAVVCIIEELMQDMDEEVFARVTKGPLPAVISIPGPEGSTGIAEARLRALAERAVGSAIL